jgi:hypothetical protein
MFFFSAVFRRFNQYRKKDPILYRNTADASTNTSVLAAATTPPNDIMQTATLEATAGGVDTNAAVQAVATGVDQAPPSGRKGRTRKGDGAPRSALSVKKRKAPKAPRNPFRRSETAKLQVKRLQMGKRVETMTPRVEVLRERLGTMESRLLFVSGKLQQVKEELTSREQVTSDVSTDAPDASPSSVVTMADMENVELDDEVPGASGEAVAATAATAAVV